MSEETTKPKAPKKPKKPSAKTHTFTLVDMRHVTLDTNYSMTHKGTMDSLAKSVEKFMKGHTQQCVRDLNAEAFANALVKGDSIKQRVGKRTFTYELKSE